MSPTSDQSIGDPGPRSSTSRMGAGQPERDHATSEPPSVERLTPCTDDRCLPHNTDHSGRTESAVQSLLSLLRLPLILDSILRITDEGEQLSQGLRSALSQRSVPEQHRIRFFACSLSRNCDDLCEAGQSPVNQEIDVECGQNHEQPHGGDVRFHDDVALGSAVEPAYITENEEGDITLEGRDKVPGSDTQPCGDNDEVKQSTFQRTDGRDPQLIHVEDVNKRSGGVGKYDAREVRAEAVRLLCSAWTSNGLVAAPQSPRRKRKAGAGKENGPGGEDKRRKVSSGN